MQQSHADVERSHRQRGVSAVMLLRYGAWGRDEPLPFTMHCWELTVQVGFLFRRLQLRCLRCLCTSTRPCVNGNQMPQATAAAHDVPTPACEVKLLDSASGMSVMMGRICVAMPLIHMPYEDGLGGQGGAVWNLSKAGRV